MPLRTPMSSTSALQPPTWRSPRPSACATQDWRSSSMPAVAASRRSSKKPMRAVRVGRSSLATTRRRPSASRSNRCAPPASRSRCRPKTLPRAFARLTEQEAKMAVYDLEEQEQIDDLKAWWATYGKYVAAAVVAVALVVIAVQGWRYYQGKQAEQASVLYQAVSQAARANDLAKAKDPATQ